MFERETMSKKATSSYQQVKPWFFGKCVEIGFRWFYKRFSSSIDDRHGLFSPVIILHMHCDWGRFNEIWFSLRYYFTFSFPFFFLFFLVIFLSSLLIFFIKNLDEGEKNKKDLNEWFISVAKWKQHSTDNYSVVVPTRTT